MGAFAPSSSRCLTPTQSLELEGEGPPVTPACPAHPPARLSLDTNHNLDRTSCQDVVHKILGDFLTPARRVARLISR
jgi:hypothetical protein